MKGRNSTTIATRILDPIYFRVKEKAEQKKMLVSEWMRRLIEKELGIRPRV